MKRVLVTGPTGCIGAATVRHLYAEGANEVVGFSRSADRSRLTEDIEILRGDIADPDSVHRALERAKPTHLIHLAAFQTPACRAEPFRGMRINLGGSVHLFEAAARTEGLERVVNASSTAVYGPPDAYPEKPVRTDVLLHPDSLYAYWKIAGEGIAIAFHRETGVPTISLRLATTYGPGRDQGFTSAGTTALKAAALGTPYAMPYRGREHYHYVEDVAAGFAQSCLRPFEGHGVFNLRGQTEPIGEFLGLVEELSGHHVGFAADAEASPFPSDFENTDILDTFPDMPLTGLRSGIEASLAFFREQADRGELSLD